MTGGTLRRFMGLEDLEERDSIQFPAVVAAGECAILIEFGNKFSLPASRAVMSFDSEVRSDPIDGLEETVPGIASLQLRFDPLRIDPVKVEDWCRRKLEYCDWYSVESRKKTNSWVFPAVYGGASGPELPEVADQAGLREDQVVDAHSDAQLQVVMLGFGAGHRLSCRITRNFSTFLDENRLRSPFLPARCWQAVQQTVLPGCPIPTGWAAIGRTPIKTFRPLSRIPFLLAPGDSVRFEAIPESKAGNVDCDGFWRRLGDALP